MRAIRLVAVVVCISAATVESVASAHAEMQTLLDSPSAWSVIAEDNRYYAAFGRGASSSGGTSELAFVFNVPARRFSLFFNRPSAAPPSGPLQVTVQFRSVSPTKTLSPLRLTAVGADKLTATLTDADVATWTHGFTAGAGMNLQIANTVWSFDLVGTTPAITAMAGAIGGAGIDGLPPPWQANGYAASPGVSSPGADPTTGRTAQDRALEAAAQKRQLDIANAEAAKARAEAQRAQAEAEKARADADRVKAQAQLEADAKAKVEEEARATAMRLAEEQRRKAAQAKAEQDARGTEP